MCVIRVDMFGFCEGTTHRRSEDFCGPSRTLSSCCFGCAAFHICRSSHAHSNIATYAIFEAISFDGEMFSAAESLNQNRRAFRSSSLARVALIIFLGALGGPDRHTHTHTSICKSRARAVGLCLHRQQMCCYALSKYIYIVCDRVKCGRAIMFHIVCPIAGNEMSIVFPRKLQHKNPHQSKHVYMLYSKPIRSREKFWTCVCCVRYITYHILDNSYALFRNSQKKT